jgi:hypothetical protein
MIKTRLANLINHLKVLKYCYAVVLAVTFTLSSQAQTQAAPKKPAQAATTQAALTNADVIQMVEAGIQPLIIKTAIRQAASRHFDLTSKGLIELKQHKVPDDVVAVMQDPSGTEAAAPNATSSAQVPAQPEAPSNEPAGLPKEQGIFYKAPSGFVALQQVQSSGAKTTGTTRALLTGGWGGGGDVALVFPGAEAPVQISESKPTFYSRPQIQSPRDLMIVRMDKKKDHRELKTVTGTVFKSAQYNKSSVVELSCTQVSADVMAVTPTTDLKDGEYLLVFSYGGSAGYDFGISQKKK